MTHAHVIGAGLAGLSAAVALVQAGHSVTLYEAGPAAGGRCRSYFDKALGARIDNGNHLLLSGNDAALRFLDTIGARDSMTGPGTASFPFMDLASGARWIVAPGAGRVPWWVLTRRVPGTRLSDYLALVKLRLARPGASVAEAIGGTALYRKLLEPLAVSALNTPAEAGLASLMWQVVAGSLLRGGRACVPLVPREGLSESFIDPAIAWLQARGAVLRTGTRVSSLAIEGGRVAGLQVPGEAVAVAEGDKVVLAVPPWVAADLLPGIPAPVAFESIINVHFRTDLAPDGDMFGAAVTRAGFIGLVGGMAEWIFLKPGIVSVTISAANRLLHLESEEIAVRVWAEIEQVLGAHGSVPGGARGGASGGAMPPVRVVREKRATFAATAASEALRPRSDCGRAMGLSHFAVAGDWTATGLPATIEGAIRSGLIAARAVLPA